MFSNRTLIKPYISDNIAGKENTMAAGRFELQGWKITTWGDLGHSVVRYGENIIFQFRNFYEFSEYIYFEKLDLSNFNDLSRDYYD